MAENRVRSSRIRFSWVLVEDLAFLVFLCAASANQTGEGFDALFVRLAFVVYFATMMPCLFRGIHINGYFKWLCLFLGYLALSCTWANMDFAGNHFNDFVQDFVVAFCLTQRIKTTEDLKRYLTIYYLAMLYTMGLLYYRAPAASWGTDKMGHEIGQNRNGVGLYAATGFILSLYYVFGSKRRWTTILNIALAIMFATVAVYSTSRKGFMMLPIGLVGFWWFYQKRNIMEFRSMARTFFGIVLLSVALWVGARYMMGSDLRIAERMDETTQIMVGGEMSRDESINERQYFIRKAQELFMQHPIAGAGSNGFAAYMTEINYSHKAYCHNNFWEILSTLGLIGFLIYYYMHAKCLYYARPWNKDVQHTRALVTVLWVLLAINVVFGWWYVYYFVVNNNILFVLTYMACYTSHALPETKRKRKRILANKHQT